MHKQVLGNCSILRIQTWDSSALVPAAVEDLLGVAWPIRVGFAATGRTDVICVGPSDWLVLWADVDARELLMHLQVALHGSAFRAANVSQALARIQLDGSEVRNLLAKGCSLDLDPPLFPCGRAVRTRFAGMPVIVRCISGPTFELIVAQSYSDFLLAWLTDAELEFESSA
jgi:sarcosine oxidase subunit gamma